MHHYLFSYDIFSINDDLHDLDHDKVFQKTEADNFIEFFFSCNIYHDYFVDVNYFDNDVLYFDCVIFLDGFDLFDLYMVFFLLVLDSVYILANDIAVDIDRVVGSIVEYIVGDIVVGYIVVNIVVDIAFGKIAVVVDTDILDRKQLVEY